MTRTPFDQFSKQFLEEFLSPLGEVQVNREVPGESHWVDIWFDPTVPPAISAPSLGLLSRIAETPCLLEPFRNQPAVMDVLRCKLKLFSVFAELQRQAERQNRHIPDSLDGLPWLWIFAATASESLVQRLGMSAAPDWPPGVYFAPGDRTALIVIPQLPVTADTLWIRLLGKGKVQQQAIATVLAFDRDDSRRVDILQLLVTWKISMDIVGPVVQEEEELMVKLSQVYLEWEQRTERRGLEQGLEQGLERERSLILRLLTRRVGALSDPLLAQIHGLSLDQLESLGEALLDFTAIADLTTWIHHL